FACLLLDSTSVFGQTAKIVGKVTDKKKDPFIGASIIYKKDITIVANTDDNVNYLLEVPVGACMLICRYSRMITDTFFVDVKENQTITHDVVLTSFVQTIEGVEVKVGKFDRPLEEQTVSLEIIRPELIENKNTRSIE